MSQPMIRVRAVAGHYPLVDLAVGATLHGRFCGRDRDGAPLPEGEWVPDAAYYRRGVHDGSLDLLEELSAAEAAARGPIGQPASQPVDRAAAEKAVRDAAMVSLFPRGA